MRKSHTDWKQIQVTSRTFLHDNMNVCTNRKTNIYMEDKKKTLNICDLIEI